MNWAISWLEKDLDMGCQDEDSDEGSEVAVEAFDAMDIDDSFTGENMWFQGLPLILFTMTISDIFNIDSL